MRPRKGDFAFCLMRRTAFVVLLLLFMFKLTASTDPHQKLKSSPAFSRLRDSKRQSPLVALARAKLRKQQSKIRLHKEKQNYQPQHGTIKSRCIKTKQQSKKPHAEKETVVHHSPHRNPKNQRPSILHAALTENSRPLAGGYASVNRFARNGGRSQTNRYPQFRTHQTPRYPQNTVLTKPRNSSRTTSQVKCLVLRIPTVK